MSTAYNRRRGASARKTRKPRRCLMLNIPDPETSEVRGICSRLAPRNRYCDEHQRPPLLSPDFQPKRRSGGHPSKSVESKQWSTMRRRVRKVARRRRRAARRKKAA